MTDLISQDLLDENDKFEKEYFELLGDFGWVYDEDPNDFLRTFTRENKHGETEYMTIDIEDKFYSIHENFESVVIELELAEVIVAYLQGVKYYED